MLNVLCLDGGGVRGLSELLILTNIMMHLQRRCKLKEVPLPCEVFDLICGTSTGGIIALMLGRLRMSTEEAIDAYIDFSRTVFGKKWTVKSLLSRTFWRNTERTTGSAVYDASILEEWVQKIVADHGGDPFAPLEDPLNRTSRCCRTFVVAQSWDTPPPPRLFRSYTTNTQGADTCAIWEVARATTAGMPFFDPMVMDVPPMTYMVRVLDLLLNST